MLRSASTRPLAAVRFASLGLTLSLRSVSTARARRLSRLSPAIASHSHFEHAAQHGGQVRLPQILYNRMPPLSVVAHHGLLDRTQAAAAEVVAERGIDPADRVQ